MILRSDLTLLNINMSKDTVDIYSFSGSLLHKIKITDDIVRINVAPQSLYIVKTGDKSFKIAM